MGANSAIEWTDHTFNPWMGCSKVHAGCTNCYAEQMIDKQYGKAQWGPNGTRVITSPANWDKPKAWNRAAEKAGVRHRVFCASLADVFEDWNGAILSHSGILLNDEGEDDRLFGHFRTELFRLIDSTPSLDWLLLTKRPENVRRMWGDTRPDGSMRVNYDSPTSDGGYRSNVWIGTSVSDQKSYDRQAHDLYHGCRGLSPVLFLSMEPLLSGVKLWHDFDGDKVRNWRGCFDWVIVGGESGHNARPMHPQWARSIRDQCQAAGVPFFFKQWGEWLPSAGRPEDGSINLRSISDVEYSRRFGSWNGNVFEVGHCRHPVTALRVGKKAAGRLLDGREWSEFPALVTAQTA